MDKKNDHKYRKVLLSKKEAVYFKQIDTFVHKKILNINMLFSIIFLVIDIDNFDRISIKRKRCHHKAVKDLNIVKL